METRWDLLFKGHKGLWRAIIGNGGEKISFNSSQRDNSGGVLDRMLQPAVKVCVCAGAGGGQGGDQVRGGGEMQIFKQERMRE